MKRKFMDDLHGRKKKFDLFPQTQASSLRVKTFVSYNLNLFLYAVVFAVECALSNIAPLSKTTTTSSIRDIMCQHFCQPSPMKTCMGVSAYIKNK